MTAEPVPSRPRMPKDYAIPDSEEGMLKWQDMRALLEGARTYWIASTRPDGRPHAVPIWGAWVNDCFYCDGHPATQWARNLVRNPAAVVHIEHDKVAVMVEGIMEDTAPDEATAALIVKAFDAKYDYHPDIARGVWTVRPQVAYAWSEVMKDATRWRFEGD